MVENEEDMGVASIAGRSAPLRAEPPAGSQAERAAANAEASFGELSAAARAALDCFSPGVWHGPATPYGVFGAMKPVLRRAGLLESITVERSRNQFTTLYRMTELGERVRMLIIASGEKT